MDPDTVIGSVEEVDPDTNGKYWLPVKLSDLSPEVQAYLAALEEVRRIAKVICGWKPPIHPESAMDLADAQLAFSKALARVEAAKEKL